MSFLLIEHGRRDNLCSSLRDGVENPCSSVQDGVGFPSPGITERLIPAHLTMFNEKECYSSYLSSGWHGFSSGSHAIPRSDESRITFPDLGSYSDSRTRLSHIS